MMNSRQQPLAWAVSGALTRCSEPRKECYVPKLVTPAAQPQIQPIKTCKFSPWTIWFVFSCVFVAAYSVDFFWHSTNSGDHIEVIAIDFDPTKITYLQLLDLFWNNHEYGLTTRVKRQYSSVIYYHSDEQKRIANGSLDRERASRSSEEIITEILGVTHFYAAEE